jgi:hypothetical protein
VEGMRPDVTIFGWMTIAPASFDSQIVLDVIEDSISDRPVYLASLSEKFYASSELVGKYFIVPEHNLYRLYPETDYTRHCLGVEAITP